MIEENRRVHNWKIRGPYFELVDQHGFVVGRFNRAVEAAEEARKRWPDQEQDEDRTGAGWDVQVGGA